MARWGRGASPVRTGLFIREHLSRVPSNFIEDCHRVYKEVFSPLPAEYISDYARELRFSLTGNYEPPVTQGKGKKRPSHPYRLCTYQSFKNYFECLEWLGFVEEVDREKITDVPQFTSGRWTEYPEDAPERPIRIYYRLTDKGATAPDSDWADPRAAWRGETVSYEAPPRRVPKITAEFALDKLRQHFELFASAVDETIETGREYGYVIMEDWTLWWKERVEGTGRGIPLSRWPNVYGIGFFTTHTRATVEPTISDMVLMLYRGFRVMAIAAWVAPMRIPLRVYSVWDTGMYDDYRARVTELVERGELEELRELGVELVQRQDEFLEYVEEMLPV